MYARGNSSLYPYFHEWESLQTKKIFRIFKPSPSAALYAPGFLRIWDFTHHSIFLFKIIFLELSAAKLQFHGHVVNQTWQNVS